MEKLKVRLLNPSARLPQRAHPTDAGADLYCTEPVLLAPGESTLVPTGIALEIPVGFEGQIRPRSGLAASKQITVLNSPATIDASYRGEVRVLLINHSRQCRGLEAGSRIAQLVISPVHTPSFTAADTLSDTDRGHCGFGSTGMTDMAVPMSGSIN